MENNESMESTDAGGMEPDKAGKEERLFTQEEVNGFIQSRLGQMKKQAAKESAAELGQREKELEAREMRLAVREELEKRGMPKGLSEVVSGSSLEEIGSKLDKINEIYGKKDGAEEGGARGFQIGSGQGEESQMDALREAFGLS